MGCSINPSSKVAVTFRLPIKHSDTLIESYSSTFYKTNYKDVIIYELPYRETFQINGILQKDTIKYSFFLFHLNDKTGIYFDSLNTNNISKKNVDSLLKTSALKSLNLDTVFSIISDSKNEIINKNTFVKKAKINDPGYDSVYFYFNKALLNLNFSFSQKLDSIHNSKLFKVDFIMKKSNNINDDYKNKFRVVSYEVTKCETDNKKNIEIIYQKYIQAKRNSAN